MKSQLDDISKVTSLSVAPLLDGCKKEFNWLFRCTVQ